MPTACSTALPAIATTTRPAKAWLMPSASIAGSSAATNHSETKAAATPAATSTATARRSGQMSSRGVRLGRQGAGALREHGAGQDREDEEQDQRADDRERLLVLARRQVQLVGERRQHHGGDREHEQRGDHPRGAGPEAQHAVAPAAGDEGEAEDEERVREDRADRARPAPR